MRVALVAAAAAAGFAAVLAVPVERVPDVTVGTGTCIDASGVSGPCLPGHEFCGKPFGTDQPQYHLIDQHGCGENDPNGPVFDPVHGVFHHFYQIHLAAAPGHGPDYGHFVSKDFIHWAQLPVAIWNGFDSSVTPLRPTPYDNQAIYTGSAVVVDGIGPNGAPGVVNIYPGLCDKNDFEGCSTGTNLAVAIPADYSDPLLTNWTKPLYNPIVNGSQRDPATPWKTAVGDWRFRDYTGQVYAAENDAAFLAGQWSNLGKSPNFRQCECPSFYPLPASSPGFEDHYLAHKRAGTLPTHVHKTSCGGDWWQIGTYVVEAAMQLGSFNATAGWEDLYNQRKIDQGAFYASKDNVYPSLDGTDRRVNWGWAQIPSGCQSLPRVVTFNAAARQLQQEPIEEIMALRELPVVNSAVAAKSGDSHADVLESTALNLPTGVGKQSELLVNWTGFATFSTLEVNMASNSTGPIICTISWPTFADGKDMASSTATCSKGGHTYSDVVNFVKSETEVQFRMFADANLLEVFFQGGRAAMTIDLPSALGDDTQITVTPSSGTAAVLVYPMGSPWVDADAVKDAPRVYK